MSSNRIYPDFHHFCFDKLNKKEKMGKKRSHNTQVSRGAALSNTDRKERVMLNEVERVRATLSTPAYLAWCRQRCRQRGGLEFDSVRAIIWRDLLLLIPQSSASPSINTPSSSGVFATSNNGNTQGVAVASSISSSSYSSSGRHFMLAPSVPYAGGSGDGGALSPNCHLSVLDCDIKRSLWHLYPNDAVREEKRQLVKTLIMRCLSHRPQLHYYQGLHEVVGFLEYTVGSHVPRETLVAMVDQLLSQHFYAFCHQNMKSCEGILYGVHFALKAQCPELAAMLEELQLGPGTHFALPWVITWFTHHLAESHPCVLGRLFDVLLCGTDEAGELISATVDDPYEVDASASMRSTHSGTFSSFQSNQSTVATPSMGNALWARHVMRDVVSRALLRSRSPSWVPGAALAASRLQQERAIIQPPVSIPRKHNATMIGLLSASLLAHHADEVLAAARAEIEAVGGDLSSAFGRVFATLVALPNRLGDDVNTLEAVIARAVQMATVPPCTERLIMLEKHAEFCKAYPGLEDISLCALNEVAALKRARRQGQRKVSGTVVKAAVTTLLVAAVAATNFAALSAGLFIQVD
jgi:hypothetical protein